MGKHLVDFFELYGKLFDYRKVGISITTGCFNKVSRGWQRWFDSSELLCVEDPQNPSVDIGKASYNIEWVQSAFRDAYYALISNSGSSVSVLKLIIRCDPSELQPQKKEL